VKVDRELKGTGRLEATASLLAYFDDEVAAITDGQTRIVPDHELVERFPLAFAAADPHDFATRQLHAVLICRRYVEGEGT